jgi:hypothetical protein
VSPHLVSSRDTGPAPNGPIFVVGSMRSGTTLLRLILDSHPAIAIGAETGFMGAVAATQCIPDWKHGKDWYRRIEWTQDEFNGRIREFYQDLFSRYASRHGKRRWGDKTPFHTAHMLNMAAVFPDAVFVGVVRHPAAVAASLQAKFHYTFLDALSYWQSTNLEMIRAATTLGDKFLLCRYEDLVTDTKRVLEELFTCLGEEWAPEVLEHQRVQRGKGAPKIADGFTITQDPIDRNRAVHWNKRLRDADRAGLARVAPLTAYFGYQSNDPLDRCRLTEKLSARSWIVTGNELALRRRAWSREVDFDARPPTLAIEASPEDLASRLQMAEQHIARIQSAKAVRVGEALRQLQHGRSLRNVQRAWSTIRGSKT